MSGDFELLRNYAQRGCENSFRLLVEQHASMVYGVALRLLHDPVRAEDAVQATFIILAQKAGSLRPGTVIGGWLHRTARYVAFEALREERRLQKRKLLSVEMDYSSSPLWDKIAPVLDEAIGRLGAKDRDALVLRYLQQKTFADVADALGTTEAAAKMRVGRALEKLRGLLANGGVAVPSAALAAALSANAVQAASSSLASAAALTALAAQASTQSSTFSFVNAVLKTLAWEKAKFVAAGLSAAAVLVVSSSLATFFSHPDPVQNFDALAGVWEGTLETNGDGIPERIQQPVRLVVESDRQTRSCEIEMHVRNPQADSTNIFHFVHRLTPSGDAIVSEDDPQIGRLSGAGRITRAKTGDRKRWTTTMVAARPNDTGKTECTWSRTGNRLTIERHDETRWNARTTHLYSKVQVALVEEL